MKMLIFINLVNWLRLRFNDLPRAFQDDLINDLEDYKELCIISKAQKLLRKEKYEV